MEELNIKSKTVITGNSQKKRNFNKLQDIDRKLLLIVFAAAFVFISLIFYLVFGLKLFNKSNENLSPQEVAKEIPESDKVGYTAPVEDSSMDPLLEEGEEADIELFFSDRLLERGEVVLLKAKENSLVIKRIIGLPGEKITILGGKVIINGKALDEPYIANPTTNAGEFLTEGVEKEIPEDHYAYLGDNRTDLSDSRNLGFISSIDITGIVK